MPRHRGEEVVSIQRIEHDVGSSGDGRRASHVSKERDFPEIASLAEVSKRYATLGHVDVTFHDDVEAVSGVALADDDGPRLQAEGNEPGCEMLE